MVDPWFDITCAASGHHNDATTAGERTETTTSRRTSTSRRASSARSRSSRTRSTIRIWTTAAPNTDTLPANYVWSFTVATGTAPPYPAERPSDDGQPERRVASIGDPNNYLMEKPEYALSYNRDLGRPNWVSWHLSRRVDRHARRASTPSVPILQVPPDWYRVQSFDFSGSGFDRGHMTPNADRDKETSIPINQATFLMSNMVAQAPDNNQGPWAAFEGYLRTSADDGSHEIYIVAGPAGAGGTGSNGGDDDDARRRPRDRSGLDVEGRAGAPEGHVGSTSRASAAPHERSPSSCPTHRASGTTRGRTT